MSLEAGAPDTMIVALPSAATDRGATGPVTVRVDAGELCDDPFVKVLTPGHATLRGGNARCTALLVEFAGVLGSTATHTDILPPPYFPTMSSDFVSGGPTEPAWLRAAPTIPGVRAVATACDMFSGPLTTVDSIKACVGDGIVTLRVLPMSDDR